MVTAYVPAHMLRARLAMGGFATSTLSLAVQVPGWHPHENIQPGHKVSALLFKTLPFRDPSILFAVTIKMNRASCERFDLSLRND